MVNNDFSLQIYEIILIYAQTHMKKNIVFQPMNWLATIVTPLTGLRHPSLNDKLYR